MVDCCPGWPQSKTESEKKDKYSDFARELKKKLWNMEKSPKDWYKDWYKEWRTWK